MTWDTDVAVSRVFPRGAICLVWRIRTVKGPHSRLVVRVEVVKQVSSPLGSAFFLLPCLGSFGGSEFELFSLGRVRFPCVADSFPKN